MTLSSGTPEVKTCPNCHGDGYEDTPPMRRCGVCRGRGRIPDPATTKGVERITDEAEKPAERLCHQAQGV